MGIRIVKTAIAVVIAIYIAHALGLESPNSAGLLAILGVEVTKRRGLSSSLQRIAASVMGLFLAAGLFKLFGFHIWVLGLYVLLGFPILARLKLKEGIVTGSVVMFHIYGAGSTDALLLLNEIVLLLVGLGTATLINIVYMPKEDKRLLELKAAAEDKFSRIFREMACHLRDDEYIWSGKELLEAEDLLERAVALAERAEENSLRGGQTAWAVYFEMRKQQLESIQRMVQLFAQVFETLPHGELLASVFDELSEDVKTEYYTGRSEHDLNAMEKRFKQMPLPATREEFEIRSALLQLVVELKNYLAVARRKKKPLPPGEPVS